jgi:hypothetical protein
MLVAEPFLLLASKDAALPWYFTRKRYVQGDTVLLGQIESNTAAGEIILQCDRVKL